MHRLGPSHSVPSEWGPCTGHYSRLTISSACKLRRPIDGYSPIQLRTPLSMATMPTHRFYRSECLDLGFVDSQFELGFLFNSSNTT